PEPDASALVLAAPVARPPPVAEGVAARGPAAGRLPTGRRPAAEVHLRHHLSAQGDGDPRRPARDPHRAPLARGPYPPFAPRLPTWLPPCSCTRRQQCEQFDERPVESSGSGGKLKFHISFSWGRLKKPVIGRRACGGPLGFWRLLSGPSAVLVVAKARKEGK